MGALPPDRPVRLDATPLGRPLYERYGFADETTLTRHVAMPGARPDEPRDGSAEPCVRRLTADDLHLLSERDERVFGARRQALLEWLLAGAAHFAHLIEGDAGPHYCFGRQGRIYDQIGPVVGTAEHARALVGAALATAEPRPTVVDAFDRPGSFTAWLASCGFEVERPLFRMCRPGRNGRTPAGHGDTSEIAILGPEFG